MNSIRVERLTKRFGDITAVDGLDLAVREGEIFGLVGPDGAGKTTTMRLLTAIMDPTSGDAWVAGRHVVREAEAIKEEIGYMSQRFGLYPDLSVMENLNFYADIYSVPRRGRREKAERLLAFSNLTPFRRRLAGNLSGGMKQKLGLACALIHTPKVLFLDEPTNGVDPVSRRDFWRILHELLRENVTIFLSTAYLDEAERCDRVALIHSGRLLACGTPGEVKRLMRGEIVEVRAAQPRTAAAILREKFPPGSVGLFGDRVHVVGEAETTKAAAGAMLAEAGMPASEIRVIPPSLEDVFISVLGQQAVAPAAGMKTLAVSRGEIAKRKWSFPSPQPSPEGRGGRRETASGVRKMEPPSAQPAVVVDKLEKRFGAFVAVRPISFQVARGEIFGFLGPNGAGKSTTIRMLCGILPPTAGTGRVAGFDVRTQPERIKENIGYMSQKFSLYQDLTVEENIDFYSGIYRIPPQEKESRKQWTLEMAGLAEHRHRPTGVLSGGWKQRLALGCAVLHRPPIVFLDEPTSGVDPVSRRQFWELIYQLAGDGVTVFVTTHYMDEAEYCDRLALIYRGELIACGAPEALKRQAMAEAGEPAAAGPPTLEEVFVRLIEARDRAERPQEEAMQ